MTETQSMPHFRGRYSLRLDPKGRLSLPSSLNSIKSVRKFFVTNNLFRQQKFLDLYPEKAWLQFERKMEKMPKLDTAVQAFRRFYLASAFAVEVDGQGRLLIPLELREYAGIGQDVVLLGVGQKLEL